MMPRILPMAAMMIALMLPLMAAAPAVPPRPAPGPAPIPKAHVKCLEQVAVLHEGRLKPMETYSRHMLLQFSGRSRLQKSTALQVMSQILFSPGSVEDARLFLINNPQVVEALGITAEKRRRYTFKQLLPSLPKLEELARKAAEVPDEKQDLVQKEVLRVYENLDQFQKLAGTFSFTVPDSAFTVTVPENRTALQLPDGRTVYSFWELMGGASTLVRTLAAGRERKAGERTPGEKELISLSRAMFLRVHSLKPSSFRVLPISTPAGAPGWVSPADALSNADILRTANKDLDIWAKAARAYGSGHWEEFEKQVGDFKATVGNRAYDQVHAARFPLEVRYQKTDPFYRALILYWLALLGCFGFFLLRRRALYHASLWVFLAGLALHLGGMAARMVIMRRPPVTSLYESFPFVAAVSILAALFLERMNYRKRGEGIGLLSASLLGVALLSIANRYAAEGDTLRMLVAVLDSNFWLSTHVICVTIGYSACLLAGAIGHVWLIRAILPGDGPGDGAKADRLKEIGSMVYGTLCFGLLFSFIGTVLGGIWADQSWGRFWGWDPKENGALLIVVWCLMLLHARQWGYIRAPGMALGSVFGAIMVSLAWFGVNLLNVGLHSYGFTSGGAVKLFSYIGAELLFMGGAALALKLRREPAPGSRAGAARMAARPEEWQVEAPPR